MANRNLKPHGGNLESRICHLFGEVTFGASGAVSSSSCKGFSVAKTASETGRYTVTLEDSWPSLKFVGITSVVAADAAVTGTVGLIGALRNESVSDSSPTFDIQMLDAAGADADPTSGFKIKIMIVLKNSELSY